MFPGNMNSRQMKKMMKQMGLEMDELEAEEVVIKLGNEDIVISSPQVSVIKAKGQKTYQISGREEVRTSLPEEDVNMVAQQAGVSREEAKKALERSEGDLAKAIMELQG